MSGNNQPFAAGSTFIPTVQAQRMPLLSNPAFTLSPNYSDAVPLSMPLPPFALVARHGMPPNAPGPSVLTRLPGNEYSSQSSSRPTSSVLLRSAGQVTHLDRTSQIKSVQQAAVMSVAAQMNDRVKQVARQICQKLTDAELLYTMFHSCLKCRSALTARANSSSNKQASRNRSSNADYSLSDIFCVLCVSELCNICWQFANGKERTEHQSEVDFRRLCQRSECEKCLCRCWICARHIEAEIRAQPQHSQTTSVKDRIFNMCKNFVTVDQSSKLSRDVYISSVERIYEERKKTLLFFKKLTLLWKDKYMPYSSKHKLTGGQFGIHCASTWRHVRADLMLPKWLDMLKKFETRFLPVINDGRAIDVYRYCLRENLLPDAEKNNGDLHGRNRNDRHNAFKFPRIPSAEEARRFFAGKALSACGTYVIRNIVFRHNRELVFVRLCYRKTHCCNGRFYRSSRLS